MFRWRKLGKVFTPQEVTGRHWLKEFAQAPAHCCSTIRPRLFLLPPASGCERAVRQLLGLRRSGSRRPVQGASGRRAADPALGGLGEFDEFGTYPVSVIRDGADVRAYYAGWTRCESVPFNVAIGMAPSHDGGDDLHKLGRARCLSYSPDEPFVLSGPKVRRFGDSWYLWYIAGRKWKVGRRQAGAGLQDPHGIVRRRHPMDKINRDLIESRIEEDEAQASPDVFYANGRYHMFFCYRYSAGYRGKENGYRIGYAVEHQPDRLGARRRKAGIDVSEDGWDSEMISYPHVFEVDGKTYLAYLGNQVGRYGFGLAVLDGNWTRR